MSRAFVGTSGWSYATWKPKFYPPEVKSSKLLEHYGTRLRTVEVNYTFNHLPSEKNVADWTAATGPGFLFALKASQRITHFDRLAHPADTLPPWWEKARVLGDRLGPVLFQTPPWLKRDDDLLAGFIAELPTDVRCALEVREKSWYDPAVYELLQLRNVALVHADGEKSPSPVDTLGETADFAYLRLRGTAGYDEAAVQSWAERCRGLMARGKDVYAYFRHDDDGSNGLSAERLRDLLGASSSG